MADVSCHRPLTNNGDSVLPDGGVPGCPSRRLRAALGSRLSTTTFRSATRTRPRVARVAYRRREQICRHRCGRR